ncbi:hypothetical protein [Nocardioides sp. zg-1228]|uniref:hypothetical protein n=1 Tax=Nocardioides sp. zg-1228 TaxID=2763008 RepID=UPI00164260BB|nr:hypothetical protein [Nocardioides sp. zg-1228]MBC2935164.1 hypothetical protein [Nocardioides sp. zg-1228]QSF56100.1 hypothetical protein JX575_10440 [Nocardioides sp. zg-1228]
MSSLAEGVHPRVVPSWVIVLDLLAKVVLVLAMARVAIDPAWGNLEGKAPGTRAVTYPLLAFLVPLVYWLRRPAGPYPWLADLMVTVPAFSDILGNRLDLYDQVVWFDDLVHFVNTGLLGAAAVIFSGAVEAPLRRRLEVSVSVAMTLGVAWEVWEYLAFVTRSGEAGTAYADTVGDLTLDWMGAVLAAVLLGLPGFHRPGVLPTPPHLGATRRPSRPGGPAG